MFAKLSSEDPSKWYKFVPQVQKAINAHVQSFTKITPFELMFGVKMNNEVNNHVLRLLEEELVDNFNRERQNLRIEAKKQIQQAQNTYKRNFDKKRKTDIIYKVGDMVAVKRTQFVAGKKLASEFLGPYEVIKVKRNGRYDVKKTSQGEGPNITSTSSDHMKLWTFVENNDEILSSGSDDDEQDGRM